MKKVKMKFDMDQVKQFGIEHGEKFGLALAVLILGVFVVKAASRKRCRKISGPRRSPTTALGPTNTSRRRSNRPRTRMSVISTLSTNCVRSRRRCRRPWPISGTLLRRRSLIR